MLICGRIVFFFTLKQLPSETGGSINHSHMHFLSHKTAYVSNLYIFSGLPHYFTPAVLQKLIKHLSFSFIKYTLIYIVFIPDL